MARRRAPTFEDLREEYTELLATMEVRHTWVARINRQAELIYRNRDRYETISAETGVPWDVIGLAHLRESGCNFSKHLHNGDPLTARTRRDPAGHPRVGRPPFTFEESAADAVQLKGWHTLAPEEWTPERKLYELERFNGWGYRGRHPSPYVWSGTTHYTRGKYVRDHVYDPTFVDEQVGIAPVLVRLQEMNATDATRREESTDLSYSSKMTMARRVKQVVVGYWTTLASYLTFDNTMIAIGIVGGLGLLGLLVYFLMGWFQKKTREDYRKGRYHPGRTGGAATGDGYDLAS